MADDFDISGAAEVLMSMLGNDDGMSKIQNIVSMLGNEPPESQTPGQATGGISPDSIEMILKMQQVMSAMNSGNNRQSAFLQSLRPLLRPERQSRLDSAVKFMSIGRAIDAFRKLEGG